jgi:hypothetical protein
MKAKFGTSQGLRAAPGGGGMAGIGSDPSYNPNGGGGGGDDLSAQFGDASKKALSFFSSVWETTSKSVQDAHISEQVSSTWGSLSDTVKHTVADVSHPAGQGSGSRAEQPVSFRGRDEQAQNPPPAADPLADSWSALSSGALGFWAK